ncbi:chemotaxis protein CheB [Blastopirellula retiformator]|uniref:protein-glutamate O-methyltransferase n=1 Tax=Blastopirellula retiformator TaxID=2527970 RepID=A0A5C5VAI2_9BACT|nr:chemotaxis protein CheB [Blastopirellula retiformator]TWT34655.1 Chemotaxis protein methyltransferase Cher2 [Blastopirellula retiformator]
MNEQDASSSPGELLQRDKKSFYVVGVGASAGGLEALERLFDNMPVDSNMAFVVVQHLSPDFKSLMDELLARRTKIPIHRVEDGMEIEANAIYLIPPKKNMELAAGKLQLIDQNLGSLNLPIDIFFRSLAKDAKERAIAVVLSGTGSDGSRGIQDVHEAGGLVVVQSIQSAGFDGMPRSALGTGLADVVCPPDSIASRILEYIQSPSSFVDQAGQDEELSESGELATIFRLFRNQYGIDFSMYKPTTIVRRIERRVKLSRCSSLAEYSQLVEGDSRELDVLYRDLLVEVTQFFRDLDAFQLLRNNIFPRLVERAADTGELRIWVPGCATGEEAYSLAMLATECIERQGVDVDLKLFASDVHQTSMETASSGVYSSASVSRMPIEFRDKYFTRIGDLYHISAELRQKVIFAPHDITKDPPFTRIDLISCRNVLIYFNQEVQKRVLSLFHFGLSVGGILFLGPSESIGDLDKEFEPVDRQWRVYRKLRNVRLTETGPIPPQPALNRVVFNRPSYVATQTRTDKSWLVPEVYDHLLAKYVPPSLLINQHLELVHSFGDSRRLLVQPEGKATLDVLRMVEGDLRTAMNAALHKASTTGTTIMFEGVRVNTTTGERLYRLVAEPYNKSAEKMFLVTLELMQDLPVIDETVAVPFDSADQSAQRIVSLERELDYTKETLQATVEELETSNEELQSANEELVASNEELQSTNEELHGVNEELFTVNSEHQKKITELSQLTEDMDHLLKSTRIGTVFLDNDLKIRKFTAEAKEVFHILDQDIGRPISHIAHNLVDVEPIEDVRQVLETQQPIERAVESRTKGSYLMRVLPYQGIRGLAGVVLTLIDATSILAIHRRLEDPEL